MPTLDTLGLSFLPGADSNANRAEDEPTATLNDILQRLSFRLPRVLGARPISPAELLNAFGSRDALGSAIASGVLASMGFGGGSAPPMPTPRVTPGLAPGAPPPMPRIHAQEPPEPEPEPDAPGGRNPFTAQRDSFGFRRGV